MWSRLFAVAVFAAVTNAKLTAQHTDHQTAGPSLSSQTPSAELVAACVQAQQQASRVADRAQARLEAARQTNSPADMRAAVDDLQAALGQIRSGLAQCQPLAAAAVAADPQAGHAMPTTQPAPARDPHAGHGSPAAPAKEGTQANVMDPVNGLTVDPFTAPKTTYQGQTYYFSSEETRKEFMRNPAKFARKPKQ